MRKHARRRRLRLCRNYTADQAWRIREPIASKSFLALTTNEQTVASRIRDSSQVTIHLDAVIFDDGEVAGLDQTHFLAYVQGRKNAADFIFAKAATARKDEFQLFISQLASNHPQLEDSVELWKTKFALRLQKLPDAQMGATRRMRQYPNLPKFYRK